MLQMITLRLEILVWILTIVHLTATEVSVISWAKTEADNTYWDIDLRYHKNWI